MSVIPVLFLGTLAAASVTLTAASEPGRAGVMGRLPDSNSPEPPDGLAGVPRSQCFQIPAFLLSYKKTLNFHATLSSFGAGPCCFPRPARDPRTDSDSSVGSAEWFGPTGIFEMVERRSLAETRGLSSLNSATSRPASLLLPRPALFEHGIIPVPSLMPTMQQLCDLVARTSSSGSSDSGRLSMTAWHKFAKETFKMDTVREMCSSLLLPFN